MKIESIDINSNFRYLWLKKVNGIDLSVHCAKCLLGDYLKVVPQTLSDGIYYLCGVAFPFKWENNFHLAFTAGDGELRYSSNGISVRISGAAQLPISESYVDYSLPHANSKAYYTCRNWQFANYLRQTHPKFTEYQCD